MIIFKQRPTVLGIYNLELVTEVFLKPFGLDEGARVVGVADAQGMSIGGVEESDMGSLNPFPRIPER